MAYFHIDVTQPHSIKQDVAFERVLKWLQDQHKPDPHVTVIRTNIDHAGYAIQITLSAYGYPVTVDIAVTPDHVTLKTNEASDVMEGLAMRFQQSQIKQQLAEALK